MGYGRTNLCLGAVNIPIKKTVNVYGVKRLISNSATTWERLENAIGLVANATHDGSTVTNDFDSILPWKDIITVDISADGTINSKYGDSDFSFTNPVGYIMTEFPEFYYKRTQEDDGYEYIYIADGEKEGFIKSEKFYLGRYTIGGTSSNLNCKSGVASLNKVSLKNFRTYANNIGTNWYLMDIWRWSMIQLLYLVEYADYNSQTTLGYGNCNSSSAINNGGCDNLGMKSGCLENKKASAVMYRGVENIFSNLLQWVDGINFANYQAYICKNPIDYAINKFTDSYLKLGYINADASGMIKQVGIDSNYEEIQLPIEVGGSETTYIPDRLSEILGNTSLRVGRIL